MTPRVDFLSSGIEHWILLPSVLFSYMSFPCCALSLQKTSSNWIDSIIMLFFLVILTCQTPTIILLTSQFLQSHFLIPHFPLPSPAHSQSSCPTARDFLFSIYSCICRKSIDCNCSAHVPIRFRKLEFSLYTRRQRQGHFENFPLRNLLLNSTIFMDSKRHHVKFTFFTWKTLCKQGLSSQECSLSWG